MSRQLCSEAAKDGLPRPRGVSRQCPTRPEIVASRLGALLSRQPKGCIVHSFLGLPRIYCRIVQGHSTIAVLLNALFQKD